MSGFNEDDHPRDESGKFTNGNTSATSKSMEQITTTVKSNLIAKLDNFKKDIEDTFNEQFIGEDAPYNGLSKEELQYKMEQMLEGHATKFYINEVRPELFDRVNSHWEYDKDTEESYKVGGTDSMKYKELSKLDELERYKETIKDSIQSIELKINYVDFGYKEIEGEDPEDWPDYVREIDYKIVGYDKVLKAIDKFDANLYRCIKGKGINKMIGEVRSANIISRYERAEDKTKRDKMVIRGYPILFNTRTSIRDGFGTYEENILSNALDGTELSDIYLLGSHNPDNLLGRVGKNMRVEKDDKGLFFECELPNTQYARDIYNLVESGILDGMSFGFNAEFRDVGAGKRDITRITNLYEITLTPFPAYMEASVVAKREIEKLQPQEKFSQIAEKIVNKLEINKNKDIVREIIALIDNQEITIKAGLSKIAQDLLTNGNTDDLGMYNALDILVVSVAEKNIIRSGFDEEDHPRDEQGKFTSSGGNENVSNKPPKISKKEQMAKFIADNHTLGQLQTRLEGAQAIGNTQLVEIFLNAIYEKTKGTRSQVFTLEQALKEIEEKK